MNNDLINELNNKIDAQDKIINIQALEIARLKEKIENLITMTVCGDRKQIKNTAQYKLELAEQRIDKAIENCKKSIESINQKLQDDKTIKVVDGKVVNMNEYQIVRLKAIRMKCKELLEILGEKENE